VKISIHTSHFPYPTARDGYVSGGGERVAYRISRELAERGHEITVFTASSGRSSVSFEDGMRVVRYGSIGSIGNTSVAPRQFFPEFGSTDVIHVHNTTPPGVISGLLHSAVVDAPVVLTHHGNDRFVADGTVLKMALDYAYAELALDHILKRVDLITIPSMSYVEGSNRLSYHDSKLVEIPNGIDTDELYSPESATFAAEAFDLDPDLPLIFFIGDMIQKKGPDVLVEAATQFGGDAQFVIAGNGALLEDLSEYADEHILLPGYISEKEKIALFNRADMFCLPSRTHTEVFPLVVLEAYASATPVLASDLATFDRFVIDGVTGLRFQTDNAQKLSACINRLIDSPEELHTLSKNAQQTAENYEWNTIIDQYETAFRSVK
jgi:glycosyltransferase involved in cell wall biosynthesis